MKRCVRVVAVVAEIIPERIKAYIREHTRPGSKMREDLTEFIKRIMTGEKISYKEVKSKSIKYHIDRMKKLNLLIIIRSNGISYIAVNPEILKIN